MNLEAKVVLVTEDGGTAVLGSPAEAMKRLIEVTFRGVTQSFKLDKHRDICDPIDEKLTAIGTDLFGGIMSTEEVQLKAAALVAASLTYALACIETAEELGLVQTKIVAQPITIPIPAGSA